jgi:hypothetical protein
MQLSKWSTVPLLAQTYGHREAQEMGRKVGEITADVMLGVILIWGLLKLFEMLASRKLWIKEKIILIWFWIKLFFGRR